jgi:hypothetical protein
MGAKDSGAPIMNDFSDIADQLPHYKVFRNKGKEIQKIFDAYSETRFPQFCQSLLIVENQIMPTSCFF